MELGVWSIEFQQVVGSRQRTEERGQKSITHDPRSIINF